MLRTSQNCVLQRMPVVLACFWLQFTPSYTLKTRASIHTHTQPPQRTNSHINIQRMSSSRFRHRWRQTSVGKQQALMSMPSIAASQVSVVVRLYQQASTLCTNKASERVKQSMICLFFHGSMICKHDLQAWSQTLTCFAWHAETCIRWYMWHRVL